MLRVWVGQEERKPSKIELEMGWPLVHLFCSGFTVSVGGGLGIQENAFELSNRTSDQSHFIQVHRCHSDAMREWATQWSRRPQPHKGQLKPQPFASILWDVSWSICATTKQSITSVIPILSLYKVALPSDPCIIFPLRSPKGQTDDDWTLC